jgi:hypothetical protein
MDVKNFGPENLNNHSVAAVILIKVPQKASPGRLLGALYVQGSRKACERGV